VTPVSRPATVLGAPVRVRDLRVGTVRGVLGDGSCERVIGLEVTGRDGRRSFLPFVAASHDDGSVLLDSSLVLVETGDSEGYGRLGAVVVRNPAQLAGLVLNERGRILREEPYGVSLPAAAGTSLA
jgi:hypothetical protein